MHTRGDGVRIQEHCGSFALHGHLGSDSDRLLSMFLSVTRGPQDYPTKMTVSPNMALVIPQADTYRGATIVVDPTMADGVIRFYREEQLLGECSGWTL